jgi:hypothetical protein
MVRTANPSVRTDRESRRRRRRFNEWGDAHEERPWVQAEEERGVALALPRSRNALGDPAKAVLSKYEGKT